MASIKQSSSANIVSLENVSKAYSEKVPLNQVSVGINATDRVGVIGINGSGKSTLLQIVAKAVAPDSGNVVYKSGLQVQYLDQQPVFDPNQTPLQAAGGSREAEAYLDKLGLAEHMDKAVSQLSGGQLRRVALAKVLSTPSDLLILDEPTNHLDPDIIEWLESELLRRSTALLFVTHDRYLLGEVANRIIEVVDGTIYTNHGSYAQYLETRALRIEQSQVEQRKRANLARRELEWLRHGPKARTSKAKYRVDAAHALIEQANVRIDDSQLSIDLPSRRIGSTVVNAHNVGKIYGDQVVLADVELNVQPNARWGIIGPNGAGKSTLLQLLTGQIQPDTGSVRIGETVYVGWYGQEPRKIKPQTRVIEAVRDVADETSLIDGLTVSAKDLLERFLFPVPVQRAYVEELSGGERRRLELLLVLAEAPNLLVLDEPTNDLDLDTLEILVEYLENWPGAMLVASHDRWFLDRVCTDLYGITPSRRLVHQPGGWTAWREYQAAQAKARKQAVRDAKKASQAEDDWADVAAEFAGQANNDANLEGGKAAGSAAEKPAAPKQRKKHSFKEQKEFAELPATIEALEQRLNELNEALTTADPNDFAKLTNITTELARVQTEFDEAEIRWLELAEMIE